ncbi:hypothetical protein EJ08DRAFT_647368 [Tothia fuscella]|uniref:Uncharacterized protein n=1 Tax=Tothia fuscella TaxID=1048955 RepID=A0A9P4U1V8_9PEZI|nr:hypothetical protein EJ08DRAFT_647368 [Tothia fuscella]
MNQPTSGQPVKSIKIRLPKIIKLKNFDFFGLPRELRDLIYSHVVNALPEKALTGNFNRPGHGGKWKEVKKLKTHGLLYACKQTYNEYSEILYKSDVGPTFHLSLSNITFSNSDQAFRPYCALSPVLKNSLRSCKFELHWNMATPDIIEKRVSEFTLALTSMLTQFPKLERLELSIWSARGASFNRTETLPHVLFERAFATCLQLGTVSLMDFCVGGSRRALRTWQLSKASNNSWAVQYFYASPMYATWRTATFKDEIGSAEAMELPFAPTGHEWSY